jgi:hypothetical protein
MLPAATASRTDWCAGSKRRLKPTWKRTPARSTAWSARSTSASSSETGFSQRIALPAAAAATTWSTWVSVLVQIAIASTSSDAYSSSAVCATGTPSHFPTGSATSAAVSWTALDLLREELGVHAADPPRPEHRDPDRGHRTTVSQPPDSHERISAACTAT